MKKFLTTLVLALCAAGAYATTPKIPGYVRIGDSFPSVYAPCAAKPYAPYANPGTAPGQYYYRYDGSPMLVQSNVKDGTAAGQGGATHTTQVYKFGMILPVLSGLHPPIPFPALPATTADLPTYSRQIAGHPDWLGGLAAFKTEGHYKEDCQGVVPTAVPTGRPTPGKPTPTKVPEPPTYCCDPSGFIHGTNAPCPGGTPKCALTSTSAPSTPAPAPAVAAKSTASPVPPVKATVTPTKKPLPPVTLPPSASASPATTSSSPTPTTSGGSGSDLGILVIIGAMFTGLMVAISRIIAGAENLFAKIKAKVKAFFTGGGSGA